MAQTFFPITPVEVTPAVGDSWEDVDVSAHIPVGATGVILHVVNKASAPQQACNYGLRKNGSTDDHPNRSTNVYEHFWAAIGVDANRVFECYVEATDKFEIWLEGYTAAGVTFFDNGIHQDGPGTVWADWDLSVSCPGAVGIILEVTGKAMSYGAQCKGSADNRFAKGYHYFAVVKCDASQVIEIYGNQYFVDLYVVGYITDGVTLFTDLPDYSLDSTYFWADMDISGDCPNSVMAFIQVYGVGGMAYGLRKDIGHTFFQDTWGLEWGIIAVDSNHVLQGNIARDDVDFFLTGSADGGEVSGYPYRRHTLKEPGHSGRRGYDETTGHRRGFWP